MKRTILCFLVLATVPALSQSANRNIPANPQAPPFALSQTQVFSMEGLEAGNTACEVNIVKASFERSARVMRVVAGVRQTSTPSLSFEMKNLSARRVESVDLMARIKVKDSIYQLDSVMREFPIHLTNIEGTQRLPLVDSALGFDSLAVEQVTFADGTTWKPQHRLACAYRPSGVNQLVELK
jgi:hypothetical protein